MIKAVGLGRSSVKVSPILSSSYMFDLISAGPGEQRVGTNERTFHTSASTNVHYELCSCAERLPKLP